MTNVLTRRGGALLERCRRWFSRYFAGAEPALCQMALAISALVAGVTLASTYWPQPWGYACLSAALLALLELGLWLARKLLKRLLDHGLGWLMALGLLLAAVSDTVKRGAGEGWTWRVWVFSALVTAALWLLAGSWWSLLRRRVVAPVTVCAGVLSLGMTALLAVFLFTDGFDDHIIRRYLDLSPNREAGEEALEPSLTDGPYEVLTLDYGPGEALEAGTVSLTRYMSRDTDSLTGSYVDAYWDYDLSRVPLRGGSGTWRGRRTARCCSSPTATTRLPWTPIWATTTWGSIWPATAMWWSAWTRTPATCSPGRTTAGRCCS